ncbi:MAG: hypothetical protein MZV64_23620 [Ignavibacteriales bacterium]|nr:hypothetical protein [Ignavibacteriales bacterium]
MPCAARVQHLGTVVARPAAGQGEGADQAREADRAKVQHDRRVRVQMFLTVILAVIHPQFFAVQLVAAVHRVRRVVVIFLHRARRLLRLQVRHAIGGDRTGEQELDRLVVLLGLIRRQHQQLHRAFHVDAVRAPRWPPPPSRRARPPGGRSRRNRNHRMS